MSPTPDQLLEQGLAHHQAGRLDQAQACYRQALSIQPQHPGALHLLGMACHHAGQNGEALPLLERSLAIAPHVPDFHNNLALVLHAMGQTDSAIAAWRKAISLNANYPQAIANLAAVLVHAGRDPEALPLLRRVVELHPTQCQPLLDLGQLLLRRRDWPSACDTLRKATTLSPQSADAHALLADALRGRGSLDEALAAAKRACELSPSPRSWCALGHVYVDQRELPSAADAYTRAAAADPTDGPSQRHLAWTLLQLGNTQQALSHARLAISLGQQTADVYETLGNALEIAGDVDASADAFRRATELDPAHATAWSNLANALQRQGLLDQSIDAFRAALRLRPDMAATRSNLLLGLHYLPDITPQSLHAEHLEFARIHANRPRITLPARDLSPDRTLRVGYVSAYFRAHAVATFVLPLLEAHDPAQVQIFCYSDTARHDPVTARFRSIASAFHDVRALDDDALARQIIADRIDLLVDLTGHIAHNRLTLFARKPAPIQLTWIGYQNTTGLDAIDYRITDAIADPPGPPDPADALYTETLLRLGGPFFCYRPPDHAPDLSSLPALSNGHITFASYNNSAKLNPRVMQLWSQLLHRLEHSILQLLVFDSAVARQQLTAQFASHGIGPDRLRFISRVPAEHYLHLFAQADIALDPFPFSGHTTTCDALWMGLPVITLAGDRYASRMTSSVLVHAGLHDWIAPDPPAYIATAARLAADLTTLAQTRQSLRNHIAHSPIVDAQAFARSIERAYRQVWSKHAAQ